MQLQQLLQFFESSAAVKLLRSPNAPFILRFLHQQFKEARRISIPHGEFSGALAAFQEEIARAHPRRLVSSPDVYLAEWSSPEVGWIQRFVDRSHQEPVYQLTAATEDVWEFLQQTLNTDLDFVGSESRLHTAIRTLNDIALQTTTDPDERLQQLMQERDRIDREIAEVRAGQTSTTLRPSQIRERFSLAVSLLRQLQGDFRAVEASFREITREVQRRQAAGEESRGDILEYALDAEDALKQNDQGESFYEFVRLVLSPEEMEKLSQLIRSVRRVPELRSHAQELQTLKETVSLLQAEAEQVMQTNQKLTASLRRLLDTRTHRERQQLTSVLREIQQTALSVSEPPPADEIFWDVEVDVALENPFRRDFWKPPVPLESLDLTDFEADLADRKTAFARLARLQRLDWKQLRQRIADWTDATATDTTTSRQPTLGRLLTVHPPEAGVVEVLGYLQIACDDGHEVRRDEAEAVFIPATNPSESPLKVTLPAVTFHPSAASKPR